MEDLHELFVAVEFFKFPLGVLFQLEVSPLVKVNPFRRKIVMWAAQPHNASKVFALPTVRRPLKYMMSVEVLGRAAEETLFILL